MAAGPYVAQALHQGAELIGSARLRGVLLEPFAEGGVKRLVLGAGHQARLLDQVLIRAQGYIFHTIPVYTKFVCPLALGHRTSIGYAR